MSAEHLKQLFQARHTIRGEEVFGHYDLVNPMGFRAPIKRVAILSEAFLPKVDGVSKTAYLTVRYLQQTGREVLVFAPDIAVPQIGDSEVVALPSLTVPGAQETRIALPNPIIWRRLQAFQPDIIHLFSPALMTIEGMSAGRALNIPVIANYQTDLPAYAEHYGMPLVANSLRDWLRYLHNGCHVNLVPAHSVMHELQAQGFRRLHIWGRGVNLERFTPERRNASMRQRLLAGRPDDRLLCLYVGRLANEKCVDLLHDVAQLPGVALTIIGDGQLRSELEQQFADTDTHFMGYLYGEELASAFASADIFCFTGASETFGQVVQEALASGLPAIVTALGGAKDLVQHGKTGYIVKHHADAFADTVRHLRDHPQIRQQMSQHARQFAESRPWSAIMEQLEHYYQRALTINQRFKGLFGRTTYHYAALPGSLALSVGALIASGVWQGSHNLKHIVNQNA